MAMAVQEEPMTRKDMEMTMQRLIMRGEKMGILMKRLILTKKTMDFQAGGEAKASQNL